MPPYSIAVPMRNAVSTQHPRTSKCRLGSLPIPSAAIAAIQIRLSKPRLSRDLKKPGEIKPGDSCRSAKTLSQVDFTCNEIAHAARLLMADAFCSQNAIRSIRTDRHVLGLFHRSQSDPPRRPPHHDFYVAGRGLGKVGPVNARQVQVWRGKAAQGPCANITRMASPASP